MQASVKANTRLTDHRPHALFRSLVSKSRLACIFRPLFVHRKAASWFPAVRGYCVLVLYALFFIFFRGLGIEQPDLFVRRCLCFLYSLPSGLAAELS